MLADQGGQPALLRQQGLTYRLLEEAVTRGHEPVFGQVVPEFPEHIDRLYPSYAPHLEGHGTIPSDRSVRSEGASSWRNAVANDVTPPGRNSGGGRSESRSGAGWPSAPSAGARG